MTAGTYGHTGHLEVADPPEADTGVLHARVFRHSRGVTVLEVSGYPPELVPFAMCSPGGDWDEINVIHEDGPPQPPKETGVWEMTWPWRRLTAEEAEKDTELCCKYVGRPAWTFLSTEAREAEVARLRTVTADLYARMEIAEAEVRRLKAYIAGTGSILDRH